MKTWFRFVSSHAEQSATLGILRLIAPLITGVDREELLTTEKMFDQLLNIILKSDYTENFQVSAHYDLFSILSLFLPSVSYRFKVNCYGSVGL